MKIVDARGRTVPLLIFVNVKSFSLGKKGNLTNCSSVLGENRHGTCEIKHKAQRFNQLRHKQNIDIYKQLTNPNISFQSNETISRLQINNNNF